MSNHLQILGISSSEVSPLSDKSASESCSSNVLDRRGILLLLLLIPPPVHSELGKHERDNVIIVITSSLLFSLSLFNTSISSPDGDYAREGYFMDGKRERGLFPVTAMCKAHRIVVMLMM